MTRNVPWVMVWLRVLLAPAIVLGSYRAWPGWALAGIVLAALVDDIYDGVLARAWGADTPSLRLADSSADAVFYVGVAFALWVKSPGLIRANVWWLVLLFGLEGTRYLVDFWKFRKASSYHSYLAKTWGLLLAAAMVGAFALHRAEWLMRAAIVVGVFVNLESMSMTLMLPRWQNDVKTLRAARHLRESMLAEETAPALVD